MKVSDLLESKWDPKVWNPLKEAIEKYAPNNAQLISRTFGLWRGIDNLDSFATLQKTALSKSMSSQFAIIPPRNEPRVSQTEGQFMIKWTSLSPDWAKMPKRNLSAQVSPRMDAAEMFGDLYLVIPFDNVKLFGTSKKDFNLLSVGGETVLELGSDLSQLFDNIVYVGHILARGLEDDTTTNTQKYWGEQLQAQCAHLEQLIGDDFDEVDSWPQLNAAIKQVDECLGTLTSRLKFMPQSIQKDLTGWVEQITKTGRLARRGLFNFDKQLLPQISKLVSPEALGISVSSSLSRVDVNCHEIWFEGGYIVIAIPERFSGEDVKAAIRDLV